MRVTRVIPLWPLRCSRMAEGEQHPPSHHSDQPSTQEGVNHDQNKDQDIQQELDYPPPPPAYPQDIPLQQANPSPPPLLLPPPPRYDYHSPFNDHPTYNIYVGNLNNQVDEGDLDTTFAPCGEITSTRVFREKSTGEHMVCHPSPSPLPLTFIFFLSLFRMIVFIYDVGRDMGLFTLQLKRLN